MSLAELPKNYHLSRPLAYFFTTGSDMAVEMPPRVRDGDYRSWARTMRALLAGQPACLLFSLHLTPRFRLSRGFHTHYNTSTSEILCGRGRAHDLSFLPT
jgi:hypothetical protein